MNEHIVNSHDDLHLAEVFGIDKDMTNMLPINTKIIHKLQMQDKQLLKKVENHKDYSIKTFRGSNVICHNGKIVVPAALQKRTVEWYHEMLCHPGETRTEETIRQHMTWKNLRQHVQQCVKTCEICQRTKKQKKKYGHLPAKEADYQPWEHLCVDMIGSYKIAVAGRPVLEMMAITMIDPATGWFEIAQSNTKRADIVANKVEIQWLTRYPWPTRITFDNGGEFKGSEFQELIQQEYGIKARPTTARNPQANSVLERVHQTLGNMVRACNIGEMDYDEEDPWTGIFSAAAWAIRSTYHTTLDASPGQLVFGRDMIWNISTIANWEKIRARKQKKINENNTRENSKRIAYDYQVGEKVLINRPNPRKLETPREGPYDIVQVHSNGNVTIQKGATQKRLNIRQIMPFHE
ncbi:MAG: integrase [Halobacteriota archaeon]|nr:integrase [Halobacteriota archaeon]